MKIVIAQMKHETNTFSPVPTPLARFTRSGTEPPGGDLAVKAYRGSGTPLGAFIDLAENANADFTVPVVATAWPSGPVENDAYEHIAGRICAAVEQGCDAILLDLHGAMVSRTYEDGEGELLRRLRAIAPDVPIGVALDMHANVTADLIDRVDAIAGFQTYPHVDMYETGQRVGNAILGQLAGKARPAMAWGQRSMLPHVMRQSSLDWPNREIQARCREMEEQGALCASLFVGFPHADIVDAGLSAVVVTDGDAELAQRWTQELLEMAWVARKGFIYNVDPLTESLDRARAMADAAKPGAGPIVLLDHYDNCASGGTMDTMTVLGAMIDAGFEDAAAFAIFDPDAVIAMIEAGLGADVTIQLGGKLDMPAIGKSGAPREVRGRVKLLSDGRFRNRGPMHGGELNSMGPTAVLDTGRMEIVVISKHVEPHDIAAFYAVGIDPTAKRFLMLKSRVHWRAGLQSLPQGVVECAGSGVCTSDYSTLGFRKVRRPIFPLDDI
jgi:microcystin degradation protein MlrC